MNAVGMTEEKMREEIISDLSLNMFVEAGAGAGKTTLIVSRIVNMLSADVEPGEIVVITFTNAAAEELRTRITDKLSRAAKNNPDLKDKLHRLNEMNISTIHSFCNVLLHEQGLMTKLPIDLEMLQDDEEKQEKKEL
ncbi:MAG: UvrD-helicase domain-containing protein, partial [Lachnospiraceae bacterium]|nr:UvrD-helicase domain-containing protein [Lachnospiraceae bacterium]